MVKVALFILLLGAVSQVNGIELTSDDNEKELYYKCLTNTEGQNTFCKTDEECSLKGMFSRIVICNRYFKQKRDGRNYTLSEIENDLVHDKCKENTLTNRSCVHDSYIEFLACLEERLFVPGIQDSFTDYIEQINARYTDEEQSDVRCNCIPKKCKIQNWLDD